MQKLNTVLLVAAIALLMGLWLRPQPGRYQSLGQDYLPYVLDTTTGKLVLIEASEEARAHYRKEQEREKAESEAQRRQWRDENCPAILRGEYPSTSSLFPRSEEREQRWQRECQEWEKTQAKPAP